MKKRIYFLSFLLVIVTLLGCGEPIPDYFNWTEISESVGDDEIIIIGQVPSRAIIEQLEQRRLFKKTLEEQLEREVQFRFAVSYQQIVKDMEDERFDLVILGPLAYVQAAQTTNYTPLVRPVRFGSPYYHSIIFTSTESGISSGEDLKNETIAFVDPDSASGYLFPLATIIKDYGVSLDQNEDGFVFLGGHDRVVEAVSRGQFAAGAVYDDARRLILQEDQLDQLPIIARTRPIPSEPMVISENLKQQTEIYEKLKTLLLELHNISDGQNILDSFGDNIEKLIPASDEDYDEVRSVHQTLREYEVEMP